MIEDIPVFKIFRIFQSSWDDYWVLGLSTSFIHGKLSEKFSLNNNFVFRIKWCGEKVTDVVVGLSRAARLLGHVQYFKHYRNLPPLYRDGPNPGENFDLVKNNTLTHFIGEDHFVYTNNVYWKFIE